MWSATGSSSSPWPRSSAAGCTTSSTSGSCTRTTRSRSSCRRIQGSASTAGSSPARWRPGGTRAGGGVPFARWADIVAPALFVMQAIGRWGNYFNQELYGPPTTLPWGIPIDCAHRLAGFTRARASPKRPRASTRCSCTNRSPGSSERSSSSGSGSGSAIGCGRATCSSSSSSGTASTRFVLENLREDNWTFFGIPAAQIVSLRVHRHRRRRAVRPAPGEPAGPTGPPTNPQGATWGALGAAWMMRPIDEPWAQPAATGQRHRRRR